MEKTVEQPQEPPRKWTSTAGPIQTKKVNKALNAIIFEHNHQRTLSGVRGRTEHESGHYLICGGMFRQDVADALKKLGESCNYTVTRENAADLEAAALAALTELKKNAPVKDERKDPAEYDKQQAEYEAAKKIQEERERTGRLAYDSIYGQVGADPVKVKPGQMAVVLQLCYDNSDVMSDYFDRHATVGHQLCLMVTSGNVRTEAIARAAVSRYPELRDIQFSWHTENYSMGHGNYLMSGGIELSPEVGLLGNRRNEPLTHGHWEVKFVKALYNEITIAPYKGYPGEAAAPQVGAVEGASNGNVSVRRNLQHDGVEIQFAAKPSVDTLTQLKGNGFRWSKFSKVWYKRYSESAWRVAHEIAGLPVTGGSVDPAGAMVQANEDAGQDAIARAIGA